MLSILTWNSKIIRIINLVMIPFILVLWFIAINNDHAKEV